MCGRMDDNLVSSLALLGPTYNLTMLPPGGTGTGSVSPVPGTTIYPKIIW